MQNILGCTCPDKVFEQIVNKPVAPLSSPHTRSITIGGRLLVYIWYVEGVEKFKENFFAMLEAVLAYTLDHQERLLSNAAS